MLSDAQARNIVARVQALRDERDELLDILSGVLDGHEVDRFETAVAVVPTALMDEIRRRVSGERQSAS